uniref:Decapping nuclease n=1 Tax=Sphenodon punctatus TaxID=8508 RepID=A0A8D0H0S1_SPHPU
MEPVKRVWEDAANAPTDPPTKRQSQDPAALHLAVSPSLYDAPFPFYRRPAEVGCFSLDGQRCYHGDARQLRYYNPPPTEGPSPCFDLRDGYRDRYVRCDGSIREGLDHLLKWGQGGAAADFVTWRGHLTKVLTTPYEKQEGWLLGVSRFRGTFYISEFETPAAQRRKETQPEILKELTYMGYKFEQYMCAGVSLCSRHKLIKWWAQSFLPGVSRIVAGYRSPDGTVVGLETFETMKIFQLIRGDEGCWKPAVCMNFAQAFLAHIKKVVTKDDPRSPGSQPPLLSLTSPHSPAREPRSPGSQPPCSHSLAPTPLPENPGVLAPSPPALTH